MLSTIAIISIISCFWFGVILWIIFYFYDLNRKYIYLKNKFNQQEQEYNNMVADLIILQHKLKKK